MRRVMHACFSLLLIVALMLSMVACQRGPASDSTTTISDQANRAIQNKGSDTLVNLALAWAETYRDVEPSVSIAVTGGGSGTGIASLINGTVDIANASRKIKDKEIAAAEENGIFPVEYTVAIDALAIIVNLENPVDELTIDQLSDMYTGRITNWKDVGGEDLDIVLLSRETNSGTHVYFLEKVVRKGDKENEDIFAPQTLLMPSSVGITSEIRRNPASIGYDGLGYVDPHHEKMISLAVDDSGPYIMPSVESGSDGSYPISRGLYMYTAGEPDEVTMTYLDWIRGPAGQTIVAELGFVPLPEE